MSQLLEFTRHYIAAGLQLCDEELGPDARADQLSASTRARIDSDCAAFLTRGAELLAAGERLTNERLDSDPLRQFLAQGQSWSIYALAGSDFWLSRNGHGAGYFYRPEYYGETGAEALQVLAQSFKEADLYRGDDGLIYQQ